LSLGYVRHVTARTIFVRHRSGTGNRHAFTENNRADGDLSIMFVFYGNSGGRGGDDKNDIRRDRRNCYLTK